MGRKKYKNKRRKKGGSLSVKKAKIKQREYISDGASASTNMYALKTERISIIIKFILEIIGIIGGIVLIICNVRDEDFFLAISNFQFRCSLAGSGIVIVSVCALIKTNPKINIRNEK